MYSIPLINACTLIALSYIALKLRNMLIIERFEAWVVPLLTGAASIVMMLLPFPENSLLGDLRYAPIIMAGLRFGFGTSLLSTLLPTAYMFVYEETDWMLQALQLLLPAVISPLYHRQEYDTGYSPIRFADGWSICGLLTAGHLLINLQHHDPLWGGFWAAHLFMFAVSVFAVTVLVYMFNDENKNWMLQRRLELEVRQDHLTRLPNLRGFMDIAKRTVRGRRISILMIDIDNFKQCNDTYGHLLGDELLREVGQLLRTIIQEQDYVARYGGEEFIIVSHTTDEQQLARYAARLCKAVEERRFHGKEHIKTTISIGITVSRRPSADLRTMIEEADEALYHSKQSGKNCYTFYHPISTIKQKA